MRIPDETIEKIQHSIDIVDVISDYVQLKKQGRNYFGLCPFHGEKTPSFSVSADKQIFHCFGCGAGGNVFSFLMSIEGLSFLESARLLAKKAQIDIPELENIPNERGNQTSDTSQMVEAHELLKKFYHHLLVNTKEGQKALDYLMERGFTLETIEKFEIGYALDSWDFATNFLKKRGFTSEIASKAGLIIRRENGEYFDRFRNRIMFPILDHQGKTVAFSGRVLESGEPKYLNSPETPIFNKSKILYNFHQARLHIRKNSQVILFEGYADVISAVQSELFHSIATMGTSLTAEQAKIISRNTDQVIVCYDSDDAGIEAAVRACALLKEAGCYVKIATMPDALDPDDYIRKYGSEKFRNDVIGASSTYMSFKLQYLRRGKNLNDEGDQIRYIEEAIKEISGLEKAVERDYYLRQLSAEFDISLDALKYQQRQTFKQNKKDNVIGNRNNIPRPIIKQQRLLPAYHKAERLLIAHMLHNKDIAIRVQDELQGNFNIEEHQAIVTYLYAFYEEGHEGDISSFIQWLPDEKLKRIISEIAMIDINDDVSEKELSDYINHVSNQKKMLIINEKELEKKEAERNKDFIKAAKIAKEIIEMKKALKSC